MNLVSKEDLKTMYIKLLKYLLAIYFLFMHNSFSQETWTATNTVNAPSARDWQTVVWTGSKMIIWGGYYYNTGGVFDPVTNSWTATSVTNAPQGRGAHSAVWTGTKMIVWGGAAGYYFNTGGIYDPLTDQWTATTTTNAPSPRYFQKAVWAGSMMIMWGGEGNSGVTNTGGKYDPVADSWAPTSTTNAPVARYLHSCVWTGSKLIVWGGSSADGLTLYNSGGIYDPVSDSWTATSTTNSPSARCSHTATWTGSKMIIWGGVIGIIAYSNTGGIYDPATDSWAALSTNNAPIARAYHTANWTGTKLVIWGGITDYQTNTGGIYDLLTNSWMPTTVLNAPDPREYHTAIWTGTKMVVWGGTGMGNMLNTGGIYYNPSVIGIKNISEIVPGSFSLGQNYPNPFNPTTSIRFDIPKDAKVTFNIYDIIGRLVATLANNELKKAGSYQVDWDATNLPSGVYFYKLVTPEYTESKKMILIK
jgi:hypothetical protein